MWLWGWGSWHKSLFLPCVNSEAVKCRTITRQNLINHLLLQLLQKKKMFSNKGQTVFSTAPSLPVLKKMSQLLLPSFVYVTLTQKKYLVESDYSLELRKLTPGKHDGEPVAAAGFSGKFYKCGRINWQLSGGIKTAGKHSGLRAMQWFGAFARRDKQQHKHRAVTNRAFVGLRKGLCLDSWMKK